MTAVHCSFSDCTAAAERLRSCSTLGFAEIVSCLLELHNIEGIYPTGLLRAVARIGQEFHALLPRLAQIPHSVVHNQVKYPLIVNADSSFHEINRTQIWQLIVCMFFNILPTRPASSHFPKINMAHLFVSEFDQEIEKLVCILSYIVQLAIRNDVPPSPLRISRRRYDVPPPEHATKHVIPLNIRADPIEASHGAIFADFANASIGGGVLSTGCVQEEILFATRPELIVCCALCAHIEGDEALFVEGAILFAHTTGYRRSFRFVEPAVALVDDSHAIVAFDAYPFDQREDHNFQLGHIPFNRELTKAYAAFKTAASVAFRSHAEEEAVGAAQRRVSTGNWGCGAFGGSPYVKAVIQLLAASMAAVALDYHVIGDDEFVVALMEFSKELCAKAVTVAELYAAAAAAAKKSPREENLFRAIVDALRKGSSFFGSLSSLKNKLLS